jgi:hypothetical protein
MFTDLLPRLTVKSGPKAPTENAPLGLHYFVASKEQVMPDDVEFMLFEMFKAEMQTQFAGPRASQSSEMLPTFIDLGLRGLTPAESDDLCNLGYNPVHYMRGLGPIVEGNYIAGTEYSLPEIVGIVRILNQTREILVEIIRRDQYELPGMLNHFLIYVYQRMHLMMNNLICERLVNDDGKVTIQDTRLHVKFGTRLFGFITEFSFEQDEPCVWKLHTANNLLKRVLLEMYPHLFSEIPGECINFADTILIY